MPERRTPPDLKFLAAHLGLSKGTVSRALNNYPEIGEQTRQRVRDAARELGYRPNRIAQRLSRGRSDAIGFIPVIGSGGFDPYPSEFLMGLSKALTRRGLDLLVNAVDNPGHELEHYVRLISDGRVDAVVLTRTRVDDSRVNLLLEQSVPFITVGRTSRHNEHAWIDMDGEWASAEAVRRLVALGHSRIALVGPSTEFHFGRDLRSGYERGLREAGIAINRDDLMTTGLSFEAGLRIGRALLSRPSRPTAIVCGSDAVAAGILHSALEIGISVPAALSVVGFNDLGLARSVKPPLTTFRQSSVEMGREIAEMLANLLEGAHAGSLQKLRRPQLIERDSWGVAPNID